MPTWASIRSVKIPELGVVPPTDAIAESKFREYFCDPSRELVYLSSISHNPVLIARDTMANKVAFGWDTDEFFQRFELVGRIGVGGFATVHRAVDKLTRELVAVKVGKQGFRSLENTFFLTF